MGEVLEFQKYRPLVRHVYLRYCQRIFEWEDFLQEAHITYFKLNQNYDGRIEFGLYFKVALNNMAISFKRRAYTQRRVANLYCESIENFYLAENGRAGLLEYYLGQQNWNVDLIPTFEVKECFQTFMSSLSLSESKKMHDELTGNYGREEEAKRLRELRMLKKKLKKCLKEYF